MRKDELIKDIAGFVTHCGFTLKACEGCQEELADFILSRETAMIEEIEKALTMLHEEAHDGIKDDYCYIHEIDNAFDAIIQRRKGGE
jgi:hypothetical protein